MLFPDDCLVVLQVLEGGLKDRLPGGSSDPGRLVWLHGEPADPSDDFCVPRASWIPGHGRQFHDSGEEPVHDNLPVQGTVITFF